MGVVDGGEGLYLGLLGSVIHREVFRPIEDIDPKSLFCVSGRTPFKDVDPKSSFHVSSGDCIQMDIDSSHLTVKLDNFALQEKRRW